jgi:hypothetical protein
MIQVDAVNSRVLFLAEAIPLYQEALLNEAVDSVGTKDNTKLWEGLMLALASCSTLALVIFLMLHPSSDIDKPIDGMGG